GNGSPSGGSAAAKRQAWGSLLARVLVELLGIVLAQLRKAFANPRFETAIGRRVERDGRHVVRQIVLAGRVGFVFIVRVAIAFAVAEVLHQPRRRIAQSQRYRARAVFGDERARFAERLVDRIALRRALEIDDALRQGELTFG